MSTLTLFKQGNVALPDYLREADDMTKALAGGSAGKQISIKGGVWRMIVGGEEVAKNEDRALNIVVLAVNPHTNRTFFNQKYEEGKDIQPTCWSEDGVKPNEEVPVEQRQCGTCAQCPQNIAGSGEGNSRACRFSRRMAVALENDLEGNVYRLQLPAKSIFGKPEGDKMPLQAYAKFLAGHGVPIGGVVTEARFDTSEAVPVLKFRAVRPLGRDEWELAKVVSKSEDAQRAIEFKMVVKAKDSAPTAPASPLFGGAAVAARESAQPATAQSEDWDEPTKRASKKPSAPVSVAPTKDVSAVLNAWGADDED